MYLKPSWMKLVLWYFPFISFSHKLALLFLIILLNIFVKWNKTTTTAVYKINHKSEIFSKMAFRIPISCSGTDFFFQIVDA